MTNELVRHSLVDVTLYTESDMDKAVEQKDSVTGSPWTIGIVENDEEYCSFLISELQSTGMTRSTPYWSSAEQCLRDEARHDLDLLILDIDLSGISGVQLSGILALKQPDLPILILSNLTSDEAVFEACRRGALAGPPLLVKFCVVV